MLIWTYDEHGGYYDHVPPATAVRPDDVPPGSSVPPDQPGSYDYTGFRVPVAVLCPGPSVTTSPTWSTTTPRS